MPHSFSIGPRLGMFLAMAAVMLSFVGGTFYGAKSVLAQSLVNEVSVLVTDSEIANKIRDEEAEKVKKVKEKLDAVNPTDCGNRTMWELMGLPMDTSQNYKPRPGTHAGMYMSCGGKSSDCYASGILRKRHVQSRSPYSGMFAKI